MPRFRYLVIALGMLCVTTVTRADVKPLEIKDGERIVWIGGAFVERDQLYGYLETLLTSGQPQKNLAFRNLGWSGDTVEGVARAVFGTPQEGFKRLLSDLNVAKPTLVMVCYGANEAHAGDAGLRSFETGYKQLLDEVAKATGARLCLVTPHRHEFVDPRLPDPAIYNNKLPAYIAVIKHIADERNLALLDLSDLVPAPVTSTLKPRRPADPLTDNGVHFTEHGYWRVAPKIAERMGVAVKPIEIVIDMKSKSSQAAGGKLGDVAIAGDNIRFTLAADSLPLPPALAGSDDSFASTRLRITVAGLDKNRTWNLFCDGQPAKLSGDTAFEHGAGVLTNVYGVQTQELRRTINKKNELWFFRHRPQNETYLFLFRKHEQGNNAVEIPQFDPLIEEQEKRIAELKKPKPHVFEIKAE